MNDLDAELFPDAAARRAAVETLDRPLLVEAGAGTGKTTLLVERILHALSIGAARMPGVVAITFTEKAAAELRLRVRVQLERRLDDARLVGPPRARLGRALVEFDRASVSTIHAFAAGLLRVRPVQAGIDSRFRTLDEMESAHLFRVFWKQWVDAHVDDAATELQLGGALLAGVRLEPDLQQLARELDVQRDLVDGLDVRAPADLAPRLDAFSTAAGAALAHAEHHCRDDSDRGLANLRLLAARLAPLAHLPPDSRPGLFLEPLRVDARAGRAGAWDPGAAAANKEMRRALGDELAALRQAISDRLLHGVFAWLRRFTADYEREKQRRGVLDFQDLLLYARRMLQADGAVRRELGDRIDLLCVDEFQDTDPLQAEIVWLLAETGAPAPSWQDAVVGAKLFLVGDPKQSIYRFRRADPEVYERCAERVLASGGLRLDIVRNFRSRPAVIDWVNGVFETLFAPGAGPRHVPLAAGPDDVLAMPAVWRVLPAYAAPGAEAERGAEAAAIVAWVARALGDRWPVRGDDGERPMQPRDVAILFARTSGIEIYEAALRAAGLPFQQEGGRQFFERQEVRDVLQALAAIDDPHDEVAVIATLRSPLFGATDSELWLHRAQHGDFVYLQPPARSSLAARLEVLAALHAGRHTDGVAGTIERLLDRTGARAFHAAQPHGAQALANLETLQRHARQFETTQGAGLREFVRALGDIDHDTPRVAEWAPQDEEENRIRVLTVHMAKGLEFPCVVLANVGARANKRPAAFVVDRLATKLEVRLRPTDAEVMLQTAGFDALQARESQRDDAEEHRLLYVAATRARDYLLLPDPAPGGGGFAKLLRAAPAALGGGGALGPFVEAGAGAPPARACVVADADLPAPLLARPARASRDDVLAASERRREWAAGHAELLQAGGAMANAMATSTPNPEAVAAGAAPATWHLLVARALDAMATGEPIAAAARRVAALHGATRHADAIESYCRVAAAFEPGLEGARPRRGVQILAAAGAHWSETWLDLVAETPAGLWVGIFTLEPPPPSPHPAEPITALAALARASGKPVVDGGTVCLQSGTFVPFAHLAARLAAIVC